MGLALEFRSTTLLPLMRQRPPALGCVPRSAVLFTSMPRRAATATSPASARWGSTLEMVPENPSSRSAVVSSWFYLAQRACYAEDGTRNDPCRRREPRRLPRKAFLG